MKANVSATWHRLDQWFVHNVDVPLSTRAPASEAAIAALEKIVGATMPTDLCESLRVHDGSDGQVRWLVGRLLSAEEIAAYWRRDSAEFDEEYTREYWDEPSEDQYVRQIPMHPQRIPIAYDDVGTVGTYLDFIPTEAGANGQVIVQVSECDFFRIADGIADLFQRALRLLESGDLVYLATEEPQSTIRGVVCTPDGRTLDQLSLREVRALFP